MKTEDLSLFIAVAEHQSQSAAARALDIPVSTVNRHLAQLEEQLGTRLFNRTTRSLTLTDSGIELLERSKRILAEIEELELSVGKLQAQPKGTVTVAAPLDFLNQTCSRALPQFCRQYPGLQLKLISYQSRQNPMDIQADLILFIGHDTPPESSLVGHKLLTTKRCFVASPQFIADHPELVHPKQLNQYPCLLSAKGGLPSNHLLWQEKGKLHSIEVNGAFESESVELCTSGAIHGQGIAWVPPITCLEHLKASRLELLFDGQYASDVHLWGLYSSRHYLPHRIRVVLEFFKQQFDLLQQQLKEI